MGLCNGYCCVGPAGGLARAGFRVGIGAVGGRIGERTSESRMLGRESHGAGQATLTGGKRPSGKALTSSTVDRIILGLGIIQGRASAIAWIEVLLATMEGRGDRGWRSR